jgi:hypothetical protein
MFHVVCCGKARMVNLFVDAGSEESALATSSACGTKFWGIIKLLDNFVNIDV